MNKNLTETEQRKTNRILHNQTAALYRTVDKETKNHQKHKNIKNQSLSGYGPRLSNRADSFKTFVFLFAWSPWFSVFWFWLQPEGAGG